MNRVYGLIWASLGGLSMQIDTFIGVTMIITAFLWSAGYIMGQPKEDVKK